MKSTVRQAPNERNNSNALKGLLFSLKEKSPVVWHGHGKFGGD